MRDVKFYLEMSCWIEEPSTAHNYYCNSVGLKSGCFAVVTGLTFKSHALVVQRKFFYPRLGVVAPKMLQIDRATSKLSLPKMIFKERESVNSLLRLLLLNFGSSSSRSNDYFSLLFPSCSIFPKIEQLH